MNDTVFKFENLLEDLQIYILARLPWKLLSQCKCVSKHWNTTLTIQAFMLRHSLSYDKHSKLAFVAHKFIVGHDSVLSFELSDNISPANRRTMTVPKTTKTTVIFKNNGTTEMSTEEVILGNREPFTEALLSKCKYNDMSNICNDLVCLFDYFSKRVGLLNLKTGDFINLPAVTTQTVDRIRFSYALGFDPLSKVYKVLSIYGRYEDCRTKVAILTVGSKHWKPVEYKFLLCPVTMKLLCWRSRNRFCFDGVIYWVDNIKIDDDTRMLTVVAFDLNREVFTDYKLDTIPITDFETIRYYLTSLKGCPTLFVWKEESDEIQQLTLFNHKNPKVTWNRRSFTAHDFPRNFPYGARNWSFVAGGSILLQSVEPIKSSVKSREKDNSLVSWHKWYDLENFAIE